jgi:class 3 adenylate cyclase
MPDTIRQPISLERRLAAIMFTDIVGYTTLMGKDSAKALDLVKVSKEIQKPLFEKHNGQWLKEMGDGALIKFNTALDAVNCAIEIQRSARADFDAEIRIGIHLGDITIEDNDVYGDGVNIASRLESIADPGGIYISESIEKAIKGQTEIRAIYLGESQLKNVGYGVRTYALQGTGLPIPAIHEKKNLSGRYLAEMHRRGVIRAGISYIIISFLLLILFTHIKSSFDLPE